MKRRRLWCAILISGFGFLLLTTAKPAGEPMTYPVTWQHVNRTCRSNVCDAAVNRERLRVIESYMNQSADPCESFHSYACGNWPREHPSSTTMMKIANDRLTERYQTLFENWLKEKQTTKVMKSVETLKARRLCATHNCLPERKALAEIREISADDYASSSAACKENCGIAAISGTPTNEPNPLEDLNVRKMLQYYEVCKSKKNDSSRAYFELIKTRLNLQPSNFSWLETLAELGRFGYSSHFLNVEVFQKNISMHRIVISPHDYEHHVELSPQIFDALSAFTKYNQSELQQRFAELEESLSRLSCEYCGRGNIETLDDCDCFSKEALTFASLNAQIPEVDWQRYLSPQLGRRLANDEIFEVINFELIKVHVRLIEQMDVELQLLYTIASFLDYLLEQQHNLSKDASTEFNCLHHMRKMFALPMAYVYEYGVYGSARAESEQVIHQIFQELKDQLSLTIQKNKMQFSPSILPQLQSKLNHLRINVGNLPKNVSNEFFNDFIAPYNFTNDFHFNHLYALEVIYKQFNSLLDIPSTTLQHTWHSFNLHLPYFPDNLDASPYYYALSNLIVIPYSYLQTPFFDASFWPALLYGDLANTLGHEMIHALDTEFLQYDANGNPSVQPLADMSSNANFCKNLACLQQGTSFIHERIADVSGARVALNAFLSLDPEALKRNGELYFLQFAQFFCGSAGPLAFQLEDNAHDTDKLRLDYVLGVVPEFAEVFNCPSGSGMNPTVKCEMYR